MTADDFHSLINQLTFNDQGLIPAVAQDKSSSTVLMLAWMNQESIKITLQTGFVHYWSRSRGKIWKKGETSGNVQKLLQMRVDCDKDSLLLFVEQFGVACHTGKANCFFSAVNIDDFSLLELF